jgi:dihydrofolate reductase
MIALISAMSEDRVIGSSQSESGMPWNVPAEYAHYLGLVKGQTVIMGRKSHAIFGKDLNAAAVLVVTRSSPEEKGFWVVHSVEEALARAKSLPHDIFVAGGASIYEAFLPHADRMLLSTIKGSFQGDAFFPPWNEAQWRVAEEEDHPDFVFRVHQRIADS